MQYQQRNVFVIMMMVLLSPCMPMLHVKLSCTMIINTTMSLSPIHHNSIGTLFLIYVIMDTLMGQVEDINCQARYQGNMTT